jgi:hypothetical protein
MIFVQPSGTPEVATFEIEARLWAAATWGQEIIPTTSGNVPTWGTDQDNLPSTQRWLRVEPMSGHKARVTVRGVFPSVLVEAVVSATVDGVVSNPSARVVVVSDPASSDEDRVIGEPHTEGNPPAVALVNGMRRQGSENVCSYDDVFPFVRSALLGSLVASCPVGESDGGGNMAVFAPDQALLLEKIDWTSAANAVDQEVLQRPERVLPIAVWIAVDGRDLNPNTDAALTQLRLDVASQAVDDIQEANTILAAGRVGVTASLVAGFPKTLSTPASIAALGTDCPAADAFAAGGDQPPEPGKLNVYYVNSLGGFGRGLTCPPNQQRDEGVVYVAWNSHSTTTLAHELGHSLGLQFPYDGHTDKLKGFDLTNFMAAYLNDEAQANARDNVTLGQAFRMNVDAASWLNLAASGPIREASAPRLACQCDPYTTQPCPGLKVDVAPADAGVAAIEPWRCADMILLSSTDVSHDGVALLSGHRWRDRANNCTSDAPGQAYRWNDTKQLRLLFGNFTSAGGCPSWLAVFFRNHGMMHRELSETDEQSMLLSDRLDQLEWTDVPPPPLDVPVNVWTSVGASDLQILAATDVSTAAGRFQGANRTGIRLVTAVQPAAISAAGPCALTPSKVDGINVYYLSPGDPLLDRTIDHDGHWCRVGKTDYIVIATGLLYSSTALAHYLGRSLGLGDATEVSGFNSSNVMWAQGTGARTSFSLGQVFRMNVGSNSWLNVSSESPRRDTLRLDCDTGTSPETDKCPKITAKVP